MHFLTCVVVYDRAAMLADWLHAWNQRTGVTRSELIVVQNGVDAAVYDVATQARARLLQRADNSGGDIGAFRDVATDRVKTFDWDVLCWITDDLLPMRSDFLDFFASPFADPDVGLVAFAFEPDTRDTPMHCRTVAFAINRGVARGLRFPDGLDFPAQTQECNTACHLFEHGPDNLYRQVVAQGWGVKACRGRLYPKPGYDHWPNQDDLMWDAGHPGVRDRRKEFLAAFPR